MKMHEWWQTGVIYQIYPRSFQDANEDGIGDLAGVMQKLDYLQWLGVTAIWLSPIYPSPMADFGYDVADYTGIHPLFGTMEDFDALLKEVHNREMKLILDLVPNHTSDQHPWFLESRSSRNSPKRDWYIWKDAKEDGSVPNNWLSVFGGSGWEWDEKTEQYYYHAFLKEQPDLNWRNPEVRKAMYEVIRFWLDKGVDGFRIDVLWHIIKDELYRDNPINPDHKPHMATYEQLLPVFSTDQPEVHDIVLEIRSLLDSYGERMMIGEIYLPIQKLVMYYGVENKGVHLPFNFQLINAPWNAEYIGAAISLYEAALPPDAWPNWVLGNHDQPRLASKVGEEQTKIAAMLLLTLRGTPTIYYGEEIGMHNVTIPDAEVQDPQGLNMPGLGLSRDPYRTPMQWNDMENGGFTKGKPWLRMGDLSRNVASQKNNPGSILMLYKALIELRQSSLSLQSGMYIPVYENESVLVYKREQEGSDAFLIALNFTGETAEVLWETNAHAEILISTAIQKKGKFISGNFSLEANEGLVAIINNKADHSKNKEHEQTETS